MIWSDNGHIHLSDIFFNLLKAVRTLQTHTIYIEEVNVLSVLGKNRTWCNVIVGVDLIVSN